MGAVKVAAGTQTGKRRRLERTAPLTPVAPLPGVEHEGFSLQAPPLLNFRSQDAAAKAKLVQQLGSAYHAYSRELSAIIGRGIYKPWEHAGGKCVGFVASGPL